MKNSVEVMRETLGACEGTEAQEDVNASTFIRTDMKEIQKCMKEYARGVIDEILTRPELIYAEDEDGNTTFAEALYSYEAFNEFKENLK